MGKDSEEKVTKVTMKKKLTKIQKSVIAILKIALIIFKIAVSTVCISWAAYFFRNFNIISLWFIYSLMLIGAFVWIGDTMIDLLKFILRRKV